MMRATVKKSSTALALSLLAVALALTMVSAALLLAGCGGSEETTTTTTSLDGTTTSEAPDTTTSTTEEITTTTTESFPPTVSHEQGDVRFTYSGKWNTLSASSASGKSLAVANASKCSVTVRFYGVGVSWVAKKSPAYGQAEVSLDGGAAQTVDLYSSKTSWKQKVWKATALELGDHTVTISWTGDKNKSATATNINVDAIVVAGVITSTSEETNSKLGFKGTWKSSNSSSSSGGKYKQADASGASLTVRFSGVRLVWIGRVGPSYGQARVSVDGGPASTVDLYAASAKSKQKIWDTGVLDLKTHTVTITWSGDKNAKATGTAIDVDAFDVTGVLK